MSESRQRDIYIAILVAAHKGVGLRLTADEVGELSIDEAIHMAALNGLDADDWPQVEKGPPKWETIDPYRKRTPGNLTFHPTEKGCP